MSDYDPAIDGAASYSAALAAKKARGDKGYPQKWPADAVERRSVAALVPYAANARTHSAGQIEQLVASIREWGFTVPVLVDVSDTVIAGHGRLLAAQQLGLDTVPVMVAKGWTAKQIKAYRLADNQLALNAAWDVKLLAAELGELTDMAELIGFSEDELLQVLGGRPGLTEPDEIPPLPEEPVTQRGDLWICGDHRILCGDCRDAGDMARLNRRPIGRRGVHFSTLCRTARLRSGEWLPANSAGRLRGMVRICGGECCRSSGVGWFLVCQYQALGGWSRYRTLRVRPGAGACAALGLAFRHRILLAAQWRAEGSHAALQEPVRAGLSIRQEPLENAA